MRTLVVGDVHGCRDELVELMLRAGADRVVLVGDLFTKGPDPVGVWQTIRDARLESVLGNHDDRLLDVIGGQRARDREAQSCVAALDAADRSWRAYVQDLPLFIKVPPFLIVHAAMHPTGKRRKTTRKVALSLRRWPRDRATDKRWTDVYRGPRPVIYGHDAVRGLYRREKEDGSPWLVGLDTGCVYGGLLSGYLVEQDRVVQVPARRAYKPITRLPST
jgi:hypothetical protein